MRPRLIMTIGLPGSGKSTWANQLTTRLNGKVKRVNKDDLRMMLDSGFYSPENEKLILSVRDAIIREALREGKTVIVDDTNFEPKHKKCLQRIADEFNVEFKIKDFTHVSLEDCLARNEQRGLAAVPAKVIKNMYFKHVKPKKNYMPNYIEQDPHDNLPSCIVCDLDGTLALMHNRSPFDFAKCVDDKVNMPVLNVLQKYDQLGIDIVLLSGRDGAYKPQTEVWLKHHKIPYDKLLMRTPKDNRKDSIIKKELYQQHLAGQYNVLFILDDRDQVVKMWRETGLPCFQVNYGDF